MMLRVQDVTFQYRSVEVLEDVSFHLDKHEILTILGPNGAGKTTILKCINNILKVKRGSILLDAKNINSLKPSEIARKFGYVAQNREANRMTAFDAILLGRHPYIKWGLTDKDLCIVNAAIERLKLDHLKLRYINEMSGGELQKVSIARAIVQEPDILLLDEPTSSLDLKNQIEILHFIKDVVAGHDVSAVLTMHDLNMAVHFSDRFVFLKKGKIFAACRREEITKEMIQEVYDVNISLQYHEGSPVILPEKY
jgi:iron complex transport system ATP-binding protein